MDKLMTAQEVADLLQVNKSSIYKLVKEEGLQAVKVTNKWRFRKEDVEEWMKKKEIH
ncbi:MAG: helix-turn-helix domain-containing protein [Candidatus Eremiobacteraeota bacterium]|nr:helix-turn-helix domain-containing protein [Candidatus Eremiobacteraeota bacterium]